MRRKMRGLGVLGLLAWCCAVSGCGAGATDGQGPVAIEWRECRLTNSLAFPEFQYSVQWPVAGKPDPLFKALRQTVVDWLADYEGLKKPRNANDPAQWLAARAAAFRAAADEARREFADSDGMIGCYEEQFAISVRGAAHGTLTLQCTEWSFTGGAHGNGSTSYEVLDVRTGARVTLDALFAPERLPAVTRLIKARLGAACDLKPGERLAEVGFIEEAIDPIVDFMFGPRGLVFHYNAYDIGPYALGETDVMVPYADLLPLARPGSPLARTGSPE